MKVAELMQTGLKTISADSTIADAVVDLAASQVSALPVIDRYGRLEADIDRARRNSPGLLVEFPHPGRC